MTALATLEISARIARLTLVRPEARNALSLELLAALHQRLDELAQPTTDATVLVLSGAGKVFCAGMDLKQVLGNPALAHSLLESLATLTLKLRALPMVSLAVAHGAAIGGGCGLVTVCDLALTHADSKMGFPETDLGVCPAVVAPWLCKKIGPGRARRVLLAGGLMSGQEAHDLGIVSHLVPTAPDLPAAAQNIAQRLAQGAPAALAATKSLMNQLDNSLDRDLLLRAAALSADVLNSTATQQMLRRKIGDAPHQPPPSNSKSPNA